MEEIVYSIPSTYSVGRYLPSSHVDEESNHTLQVSGNSNTFGDSGEKKAPFWSCDVVLVLIVHECQVHCGLWAGPSVHHQAVPDP